MAHRMNAAPNGARAAERNKAVLFIEPASVRVFAFQHHTEPQSMEHEQLTPREELIAQRAAEIAIEKVAAEVGRAVVKNAGSFLTWFFTIVGSIALAAWAYMHKP